MFEYQFENIEENNFSLGKKEKLFLNLDNKKDTNSIIKKIKNLFRANIKIKKSSWSIGIHT